MKKMASAAALLLLTGVISACSGQTAPETTAAETAAETQAETAQDGAEESTVLFQERRYPARVAAFMNSVYGHGAELEDRNKRAAELEHACPVVGGGHRPQRPPSPPSAISAQPRAAGCTAAGSAMGTGEEGVECQGNKY